MRHKTLFKLLAALMSMTTIGLYAEEHEYVDLGLPSGTLWATCNVGAYSPEEYGNYYAWGETTTKTEYNWSTYQWCNESEATLTKYCSNSSYGYNGFTDQLTELDLSDDVAYIRWGNNWCMPSKRQFEELISECTWIWVEQNGVSGYEVKSKSNDRSIFFPAAGFIVGQSHKAKNGNATYWTKDLCSRETQYSWLFYSDNDDCIDVRNCTRFDGRSVRPVRFVPTSSITLNYESYTFGRIGKTVQLEANVLPENASYKKVAWKSHNEAVCVVADGLVISTGEGTTMVSATTADGDNVAYCTITVEPKKCAKPTITYKKGKLTFDCETEDAQFESEITNSDIKQYNLPEIELSVSYTIRVRAIHADYENSDEVFATLCWIDVEPQTEGITEDDEVAVAEVKAMPVLIQRKGNALVINGAPSGTPLSIYDLSGKLLGSETAQPNSTRLSLSPTNDIVIVKVGERSIKVAR